MTTSFRRFGACLVLSVLIGLAPASVVKAAGQFPPQTSSGSVGLQGEISSPPPKQGATIAVPANGASFSAVPITVSGLCPTGLLIKVFSNNVFVGSTMCQNGSYSLQVDLFDGRNDLVARDYDALDQAGPDSNVVTVTFNDVQFTEFGTHVSLTSDYAERGAPPGQEIDWPISIDGGNGPYAISVDWGDGGPTDLISQSTPGQLTLKHTYKQAGTYRIIVKGTDKNGGAAFLQLVGVAIGATQSNAKGGNSSQAVVKTVVLWWPALAMIPLIFASFWIGRRHELFSLRRNLERNRDQVK